MKTIILLHGGTLNKKMWLPQINELKNDFMMLSIDLPRHGGKMNKPFTFESAVAQLDQYIKSQDITGHVVIVGLSLGGYVAIEYAKKYPATVSGLVLSGCCVQYFGIMGFLAKISLFFSHITSQNKFEIRQRKILSKITSNDMVNEICDNRLSLAGGKESINQIIGRDFIKSLANIDAPILLLNGENDVFNRKYEHKYLQIDKKISLEIIKDSGHLCNLEKPLLFSQFLRNFMSEIHA